MANKRQSSSDSLNWKRIVDFFAFVGLVFIGIAILLSRIFKIGALYDIGLAIAIVITAVRAFYYARSKRSLIYIILWAGALVLVLIAYILVFI